MPKISIPKGLEEKMDRFPHIDRTKIVIDAMNKGFETLCDIDYAEIKGSRKDRKSGF